MPHTMNRSKNESKLLNAKTLLNDEVGKDSGLWSIDVKLNNGKTAEITIAQNKQPSKQPNNSNNYRRHPFTAGFRIAPTLLEIVYSDSMEDLVKQLNNLITAHSHDIVVMKNDLNL